MSADPYGTFSKDASAASTAASLSEFSYRYYGWRVVLASSCGVMAGFGSLFVYTFTVFVKPLSSQFGWSREAISSGFGFAAITLAIVSPFLGRWLDRYGARRIILVCMAVFGCAMASLSVLGSNILQFYFVCIVLGAVGNGAAHLSFSRSISTWFRARLGMAFAFVMFGAGFGAILLPPITQTIITHSGWRASYAFLGCFSLLLGLPLSWGYIRERADVAAVSGDGSPAVSAPSVHSGPSWQQGLRSYPFWIIVAVLFLSSVSMNGAITHLSALLTDRGITAADAALCASMIGGASLLGRVFVGWLLDRFFGARVAFFIYVATAFGILVLARASSFSSGTLAAALIGIGAGGEADITPYLLTRYFGLRSFSTLYGITWTFYAIAGALGPILLGRAYDSTGSYATLLTILSAATAFGALLMLTLPRYAAHREPQSLDLCHRSLPG